MPVHCENCRFLHGKQTPRLDNDGKLIDRVVVHYCTSERYQKETSPANYLRPAQFVTECKLGVLCSEKNRNMDCPDFQDVKGSPEA